MNSFAGKRATVMGLGVHGGGLGVARYLAAQGAHVTVTDLRNRDQLAASIAALAEYPITYVLGEHRDSDFIETDLVVRNPGVPQESRYLALARKHGVTIEMEMTLFFRLCPGPILGVTGTKGKTTTTMLAGSMLRERYPDTVIAGNLRVSALEQLPQITPTTPVILELSSWQLEGLGEARLSPAYACVTNLTPDHLDRYASMEAYGAAKKQIFLHQGTNGVVVLPSADPIVSTWAGEAPGKVIFFHSDEAAEYGPSLLQGVHNTHNIAAAAALTKAFGLERHTITKAIASFQGVEHRMEFVREHRQVRYINDTAATTPTAAAAALSAIKGSVILIAGGADKGLSWEPLVKSIANHQQLRAVLLLEGTATPMLQAQLSGQTATFTSLDDAIAAAAELGMPGDTVLLSPGAASFGMFRNEFHRGEEFRRLVGAL